MTNDISNTETSIVLLTPLEKFRTIIISAIEKAKQKGIKIINGKFFKLDNIGSIKECCAIGAMCLSLGEETSKEIAKRPKQGFIFISLQEKELKDYTNIELADFVEGFDYPDYTSSNPYFKLGQELWLKFGEKNA